MSTKKGDCMKKTVVFLLCIGIKIVACDSEAAELSYLEVSAQSHYKQFQDCQRNFKKDPFVNKHLKVEAQENLQKAFERGSREAIKEVLEQKMQEPFTLLAHSEILQLRQHVLNHCNNDQEVIEVLFNLCVTNVTECYSKFTDKKKFTKNFNKNRHVFESMFTHGNIFVEIEWLMANRPEDNSVKDLKKSISEDDFFKHSDSQ